jgi:hypothetical protein
MSMILLTLTGYLVVWATRPTGELLYAGDRLRCAKHSTQYKKVDDR